MLKIIDVKIDSERYPIYIGRSLENHLLKCLEKQSNTKKIILVTDKFFATFKAKSISEFLVKRGFECLTYEMKGGKDSKSFSELIAIYGMLEENNFSRDSTLIALGGGVIGDLGGFAASTWYRGMNLIQMPTSLMAMVDSSVGGKVAINFRETINAVGNYYHPIVNLMDLSIIDSLPKRDYISGLAEVIKCALIKDDQFLLWLEHNVDKILSKNESELIYCIERAVQIKIDHVNGDLKESGKRLLLNFGHTLGHAIEMATHTEYGETFRHGEGVSLGIVGAMYIANKFLGLPLSETQRVINILKSFKLPITVSSSSLGFSKDELIDLCIKLSFKDKKRKNNSLRFILLDRIGSSSVHSNVPSEFVKQALEQIIL
jgi:3-dehydroquinate synthase